MQGCSKCGSTTHKSAMSFACPEHKCASCQDTLEPKGHNRNHCPRMQTTICEECGETGRDANKCPIRPCSACGLRSHKLQTSRLCPERVCTLCNSEEEPQGHNNTILPTCRGRVPTDVSVPEISLRADGITQPITGWDYRSATQAHAKRISTHGNKLASGSFKCDTNRKYDQIVRHLKKPILRP
jgi:hypothetical protein